eukprot:Opistho-1_new@70664
MRDRLSELKFAAQADGNRRNEEQDVERGVPDEPQGDADLPLFFEKASETRDRIGELEKKVRLLSERFARSLASISDTEGRINNAEIDRLMDDARAIATRVRNDLQSLEGLTEATAQRLDREHREREEFEKRKIPRPPGKPSEIRVRENQHTILTKKFAVAVKEFNDIQTTYKQKYADRIRRQVRIVKPDATAEEVNSLVEGAGDATNASIFARQILSTSHAEAQQALDDIQERHRELVKLEESIRELHQLFVDVALLVESQGEMVDSIESNVTNAADYVEDAEKELGQALRYKRRCLKIKCILLLVLLILIAVAVIAIVIPLANN